jgi:hypothetical protein
MAETYITPQKLFMEYEMVQFNATDEGENATREDKSKHRAFLKEHFKQLPKNVLDVYEMKVRETSPPWLHKGSDSGYVE